MKKICGIYRIISPIGKIYIGQSVNCQDRFRKYKKENCKEQVYLFRSLKKYGWINHKCEIIHECSREQLNELEKYYVDLFQTFNTEYGMNLRDGGGSKGEMSNESKNKLSQRCKGNNYAKGLKHSEETKQKISTSLIGNKYGVGNKNCIGRIMSDETRKKIGSANTGKKRTTEMLERISNSHKRKGNKIIFDTITGIFYESVKEICELLNINTKHFRRYLKSKNRETKYIFA